MTARVVVDVGALVERARALSSSGLAGRVLLVRPRTAALPCPAALRAVLLGLGERAAGPCARDAAEARLLSELGFDDILVEQPPADEAEAEALAAVARSGRRVAVVVDSAEQVDRLAGAADPAHSVGVAVELDETPTTAGVAPGPLRSALRSVTEAAELLADAAGRAALVAFGAVVAGPPGPSLLARAAAGRLLDRRRALVDALAEMDLPPRLVDLSDDIALAAEDSALVELAAGDLLAREAVEVRLPVVRRPSGGKVACAAGVLASALRGARPAGEGLRVEGWRGELLVLRGAPAEGAVVALHPERPGPVLDLVDEVLLAGPDGPAPAPTLGGLRP